MSKYKEAGVNIDVGNEFVERLKPLAKPTMRPGVVSGIGGFAALFALDLKRYREPLLVSGTDGVGTKVLIAQALERWDTVGRDLVAMSVNDILTLGAESLFFLDYLAVGKLDLNQATELIKGIAAGCKEAGCALLGGETAEMPGLYTDGDFDLAGFAVGVVEKADLIDGRKIKPGDQILGLASSGLHSNGYSLARKVLLGSTEKANAKALARLQQKLAPLNGKTLGEVLLEPTRIYVKPVLELLKEVNGIKGIAHITGGGFIDNIPRILPEEAAASISKSACHTPPIFKMIQEEGQVDEEEMYRTLNMGIGMILVVEATSADRALLLLNKSGEKAYHLGEIKKRAKNAAGVELKA